MMRIWNLLKVWKSSGRRDLASPRKGPRPVHPWQGSRRESSPSTTSIAQSRTGLGSRSKLRHPRHHSQLIGAAEGTFMGSHARGVVVVALFICFAFGFAVWLGEIPESNLLWVCRIGLPVIGGLLVCFVVWASCLRKDRVPDYLRQRFCRPFEQDGFCFGIDCVSHAGEMLLDIYFQSRYSGQSHARIGASPIPDSFVKTVGTARSPRGYRLPGAAFGVARVPWPSLPSTRGNDNRST